MESTIFLRLNETTDSVRPRDDAGGLLDLETGGAFSLGATNMPPIVDGAVGFARSFGGASSTQGVAARDVVPGSTLHNRDVSVQAILTWDIALASGANPGTIIARGTGASAAEYVAYGLEVRLVNAANLIGELRWLWMDTAGVLKTQIGAHFQARSGFMMITATRRWVSSSEVVLRYYLADELIGEVPSVDGSIGGGTTALTTLGMRYTGGAFSRWYGGKIDELRVVPRELTHEEVKATYRRITIQQPNGYTLLRELHDPGFPMSRDPSSRVQRETRLWGDALGFAAAQADNMRDNIMPDRAYGRPLEQWEGVTAEPPKPGDSVDTRRARVVGHLRQRAGESIDGVKAAVKDLADTDTSNLVFLAFNNTIEDSAFVGPDSKRWWADPVAQWTSPGDTELRVQAALGANIVFDGPTRNWYRCLMSVDGYRSGYGGGAMQCQAVAKLAPTTIPQGAECGLVFYDFAKNNALLFGLRQNDAGGTYQVASEVFLRGVSQGATIHATSSLATHWFRLGQDVNPSLAPGDGEALVPHTVQWSTTSATAGFSSAARSFCFVVNWVGFYARAMTDTTLNSGLDVRFDDAIVRARHSARPFHWYVYRNPALAGRPDKDGVTNVIKGLSQAHTKGRLITATSMLCDDATLLCDSTPMGAI